jgi:hypothetical protein
MKRWDEEKPVDYALNPILSLYLMLF